MKQIDIIGGESVYCIDEIQLRKAFKLAEGNTPSANKIKSAREIIESDLSRNERAALAFLLIDGLLNSN